MKTNKKSVNKLVKILKDKPGMSDAYFLVYVNRGKGDGDNRYSKTI